MSKRARFFIISLILGFFLWLTGLFGVEKRLALVLSVSGIAYVLSAWVLFEDLKGWEWVTLLILPVFFTYPFVKMLNRFISPKPPSSPGVVDNNISQLLRGHIG